MNSSRRLNVVRLFRIGLVGFLLLGSLLATATAGAQEAAPTATDTAVETPTDLPPVDTPVPTEEPTAEPLPSDTPVPTEAPTAEPTVAVPPTIQSDKADYAPGEIVTLTGANWTPGELVLIFVNDDVGQTWNHTVSVTAAEDGTIIDVFQLPSWFVATYSVTATGGVSGVARTTFTDAPLPSSVQLRQWETNPPSGPGGWVNGNLGDSNSDYSEGETIPFRLDVGGLSIANNPYTFSICRGYENGTKRGYLFLAPFSTSRTPSGPGPGDVTSTSSPFSGVGVTFNSVTEVGGQGACNAGDRETQVSINSTGAATAYVLWGGHLASPIDAGVGAGNGAASYPGSSLHMGLLSPSKDRSINPSAIIELATITVTKVVDSGSAAPDQWCFSISPNPNVETLPKCPAPLGNSVQFLSLPTGFYTITETSVAGYTFSGDGPNTNCTFSGSTATASVTAATNAVNASCTFHNTQQQGRFQLDKDFVGVTESVTLKIGTSQGGSQVDSQVLSGDGTTGENTVNAGTYFVSEVLTTPANYIVTLACFNDADDSDTISSGDTSHAVTIIDTVNGSVQVGPSEDVICLFTNDEDESVTHGNIQLDKDFVGSPESVDLNIGTTQNGFETDTATVWIDGTTGENFVTVGTYFVSEVLTTLANYDVVLECFNDLDDSETINFGDTSHAVTSGTGAVVIAGSDDVICRFTNSRLAQVKVVKDLVPSSDTGLFNLKINGTTEFADATDGDDTGFVNVSSLTGNSVGELAGTGTSLGDYDTSIACDNADATVGLGTTLALSALAYGDQVTCTITNSKHGHIIVDKVTIPSPDPTNTMFGFSASWDLGVNPDFSLTDADTPHDQELSPGIYSVSEIVPPGWTLLSAISSDGSPANALSLQPGETITVTFTNIHKNLVTDSGFCTFDTVEDVLGEDGTLGNQFRLIFTPDMNAPTTWKLNASNPGQFYYNVFFNDGTGENTISLEIPYPFVTQGNQPIHFYSDVETIEVEGQTCLVGFSDDEIGHQGDQITLADYNASNPIYTDGGLAGVGFGDTVTVAVTFASPTGFAYVNIHVDYGLKGTTGWTKGASNVAISLLTLPLPTIPDFQPYTFSAHDGITDSATVESHNVFKRDPGIAGFVQREVTLEPAPGVMVEIRNSSNVLVATVYTNDDGYFMWQYRHIGKAVTYIVKLPDYPTVPAQTVTLKSNGFVVVTFTVP